MRFYRLLACLASIFLLSFPSLAQKPPRLVKIWETDSIIRVPESVLFDGTRSTLFVSLIDGKAWDADGKGGVAKMSLDGTTTDQDWITGLNCPKGMGIVGNKLYVADLNEVVVINIRKGSIEERIKPEGAQHLNDVCVAPKGVVYVSDSEAGRVYKIDKGDVTVFMDSLPGLNGVRYYNYELAIAAGKNFIRVSENKKVTKIAELPEAGDGIEPIGNSDWLVSSWLGMIYYVHADGKVDTMLDTQESKKNTADIGYDYINRIVYVPTFYAKTVAAYRLELK